MKQVLVPFTTGVEEIELVAIVDILRRADIHVCMASLDGKPVLGRSKITIQADDALANVSHCDWDMIVLPGGLPNAQLLRDHTTVKSIVLELAKKQKVIAAICAAPTALAAYGITQNKRITSYPTFQSVMEELQPSSTYLNDTVVEDGLLITSRGAGTAIEFSLHLIATLCNQDKADEIRQSIVA